MKSILIVDDNEQNLYLLQMLLEGNGYRVDMTRNGVEALEKALLNPPEMVVSDILMPVMDGFELCRRWKSEARLKGIPFVFYTATYTDPKDEEFALGLGAEKFIVKPQEPDVFLSILKEVFASFEAGQLTSSGKPEFEGDVFFQQYNQALVRKLEQKMLQVEESNRRLEQEALIRVRAEKSLRESEERFRNMFEHSTVGKALVSPEGRLLQVNQAFGLMLGCSPAEMMDTPIEEYTHPEDIPTIQESNRCLLNGDMASQRLEMRFLHHDGRCVWADVSSVLLRNGSGDPLYFITSLLDISERKRLEEQLQQAMKMESMGRLAGGVAHDFNNALTPIIGISDIMLNEIDPGNSMYEGIKAIRESGEHCATLTRQLLAFSRKQPLDMQVFNLNQTVSNMEKLLARVIGEDIELERLLDPGLGNVRADVGRLEQIIVNLAVNARDAMPDGGKLTLETGNVVMDGESSRDDLLLEPGPYVMLAVRDTGIGMDAETRSRIFEPFFTTKEKGKGTGLGLSTVYGIVKQSGGDIRVYSEPGKGSTFEIYLPLIEAEVDAPVAPVPAPERDDRGSETILLVEDEESVRRVIERILSRQGYRIISTSNAEEAIALCGEQPDPIHLVITDVVMPGISGREMVNRLVLSRPEVRVLFISGYTENAIIHHEVLEQGNDFLQKPFSVESLTAKVREVLDRD